MCDSLLLSTRSAFTRLFRYGGLEEIIYTKYIFYRGSLRSCKKDRRSLAGFPEVEHASVADPEECDLAPRVDIITREELQIGSKECQECGVRIAVGSIK